MRDVKSARVEPPVLVAVILVALGLLMRGMVGVRVAVEVRADVERLRVKRTLPGAADLLVDEVRGPGYVHGGPDPDRRSVQVSRSDLGHMATAVDLFVLLAVLVVVVRLERELRAADGALEAAAVEEGEVLERADSVHLVDRVVAPQTRALVEVGSVHGEHTV